MCKQTAHGILPLLSNHSGHRGRRRLRHQHDLHDNQCFNNIVKLYATFDDSTYLYLLLEYMEEGTLFNYLKKQKTLREEEAAVKVKQVA